MKSGVFSPLQGCQRHWAILIRNGLQSRCVQTWDVVQGMVPQFQLRKEEPWKVYHGQPALWRNNLLMIVGPVFISANTLSEHCRAALTPPKMGIGKDDLPRNWFQALSFRLIALGVEPPLYSQPLFPRRYNFLLWSCQGYVPILVITFYAASLSSWLVNSSWAHYWQWVHYQTSSTEFSTVVISGKRLHELGPSDFLHLVYPSWGMNSAFT